MFSHLSRHTRGMTLVEVVISISIFVMIMVAVAAFQYNVFSYQKNVNGSLQTVQDAQVILKTFAREIRSIAPSANGSYPIVSAATNTLSFFVDTNGDGVTEEVRYFLTGTTIKRGSTVPSGSPLVYNLATESTTTLVWNVRNSSSTPVFEYYDASYTGSTTPLSLPVTVTSIRLIKVNLTLDIDPNRSPLPRTYSTFITLRNLKDNL